MPDVAALAHFDPYDLQDAECVRLEQWFEQLDEAGWAAPSACDGWSRRDLLAHLVATERYFTACLNRTVAELVKGYTDKGADSLASFNAMGVATSDGVSVEELLDTWNALTRQNRPGFRAADGTDIDTSIGAYPCRLQSFHVASEYAIHANDVGAPVAAVDRLARQQWLGAVAELALTETKDDVEVAANGESVTVTQGELRADLDMDTFVAGVFGRETEGSLSNAEATMLALGY